MSRNGKTVFSSEEDQERIFVFLLLFHVKRKNDADGKRNPLYFDVKRKIHAFIFLNFSKKFLFLYIPKIRGFFFKSGL